MTIKEKSTVSVTLETMPAISHSLAVVIDGFRIAIIDEHDSFDETARSIGNVILFSVKDKITK